MSLCFVADARHSLDQCGLGRGVTIDIDLGTGELATKKTSLSDFFAGAKELHRRFIFRSNWLTLACAFAMLGLAAFGLLLGFTRLRNNVSGWHKGVAWFFLPLVVVSPLTGLLDGLNITFVDGMSRSGPRNPPLTLIEAIGVVNSKFDLSTVYSISTRDRASIARVFEDGELRSWYITREDLRPMPRNIPREIHEGTWSAIPAMIGNVITSIAILVLIGSGLVIWGRRKFRMRRRRPLIPAAIRIDPHEPIPASRLI